MANHIENLYLQTCLAQSRLVTTSYSTSFSSSLILVDRSIRPAIYAIYGMVRVADEIVDAEWEGLDKREELDRFEAEVMRAIKNKFSSNQICHAFQWAYHMYRIDPALITAFFASMRMDTEPQRYDDSLYATYIYGSAEAMGLMSLSVFCEADQKQYNNLAPGARALGSAFQKVNFLRDCAADYNQRGRIYFPGVASLPLTPEQKLAIEHEIAHDFKIAAAYITALPAKARKGVYLSYLYYTILFGRIQALPAEGIMQRIRVSNWHKGLLFVRAALVG